MSHWWMSWPVEHSEIRCYLKLQGRQRFLLSDFKKCKNNCSMRRTPSGLPYNVIFNGMWRPRTVSCQGWLNALRSRLLVAVLSFDERRYLRAAQELGCTHSTVESNFRDPPVEYPDWYIALATMPLRALPYRRYDHHKAGKHLYPLLSSGKGICESLDTSVTAWHIDKYH